MSNEIKYIGTLRQRINSEYKHYLLSQRVFLWKSTVFGIPDFWFSISVAFLAAIGLNILVFLGLISFKLILGLIL